MVQWLEQSIDGDSGFKSHGLLNFFFFVQIIEYTYVTAMQAPNESHYRAPHMKP